ncbi:CTU2 [Candida oxycetoniae]|uniref:Cytoplasmic tRNA 2-thiolation protein 2 n=1 Tax=Candida oxycetoniae TaxID=497107 RepID=A0AAI9WX83_9ASCO|nr:CTU2 [Candida oxycetoniae]KAI3403788.2 CTU2 [Candida oxycetoniae]
MKAVEYLQSSDIICQKCKTEQVILKNRSEMYCCSCYLRFIRGKQRKHMSSEKYKVNYKRQVANEGLEKVLLAFSGGTSSLVLLDVLANLLVEQKQMHRGLQGFELVVVNLDEYELKSLEKSVSGILVELLQRFPSINCAVKIISLDSYIDSTSLRSITVDHEFTSLEHKVDDDESNGVTLSQLLNSCSNKSSAEDLLTIASEHLLLKTAFEEKCGTIVYGHSMSRLANEVLSLTVKGRGSMIHRKIVNRVESYGCKQFSIIYPFRDLLQVELEEYAKLSHLEKYIVRSTNVKSKVSKNQTVGEILANYLENLDESGYVSTTSTVVKIAEKLGPPPPQPLLLVNPTSLCQVCGTEIYNNPKHWLKMITVSEPAPLFSQEEKQYAAEYFANPNDTIVQDLQSSSPIDLCYGCIVAFNGVKDNKGLVWPVQPRGNLNTIEKEKEKEKEKENILKEFILTDNE